MKKQWGSIKEATALLSQNAGRPIDGTYVRSLARLGRIRARAVDGRTSQYHLGDCASYHVATRTGPRKERPYVPDALEQAERREHP